jgi:5'-nucleotidase
MCLLFKEDSVELVRVEEGDGKRRGKKAERKRRASSKKPLILLSNDDGIRSEGLVALEAHLKKIGEVYVVAPDRERSAAAHSLTLHRPLRMEKLDSRHFAVDGTPTDCVTLALHGSVLPRTPDILVSGINKGWNMGEDITYSGTVSAAMEGTLLGIPSIAMSLAANSKKFDFTAAARFSLKLVRKALKAPFPDGTLLNVNVPSVKTIKGVRITRQGKRTFGDVIFQKVDPRGKEYFWIGGSKLKWEDGKDTDFAAIARGYISITPIHLDMTNYSALSELQYWKL